MHADFTISLSTLLAFALVLARITGAFAFVPLPIKDAGPSVPRIVVSVAMTIALFPVWPKIAAGDVTPGMLVAWIFSEVALGISIGVAVSLLSEALTFGAHVLALQAGFGYASIVDPTTQADSDVLPVMAQLLAGLLFFTTGLHRTVLSTFAYSLTRYPPGSFVANQDIARAIVQLGSGLFTTGVRLAFPVIGLLLMAEIALALLGRINSQLHMTMLAFPAKIMITLLVLTSLLMVAPDLYSSYAEQVFRVIEGTILR